MDAVVAGTEVQGFRPEHDLRHQAARGRAKGEASTRCGSVADQQAQLHAAGAVSPHAAATTTWRWEDRSYRSGAAAPASSLTGARSAEQHSRTPNLCCSNWPKMWPPKPMASRLP
jgi:hypothetical protein